MSWANVSHDKRQTTTDVKCENKSRTTCSRFHRLHSESTLACGCGLWGNTCGTCRPQLPSHTLSKEKNNTAPAESPRSPQHSAPGIVGTSTRAVARAFASFTASYLKRVIDTAIVYSRLFEFLITLTFRALHGHKHVPDPSNNSLYLIHSRNTAGPPSALPIAAMSALRQPLGPGSAATTTPLATRFTNFAGGSANFAAACLIAAHCVLILTISCSSVSTEYSESNSAAVGMFCGAHVLV